jgi:hypothetical protein
MLPGLRSDPQGSVTASSASLALRDGQIELTWQVIARLAEGGAVTIQMPQFGWLGESEPYPDRHFPELKVLTDGAPAAMESSFSAFVGATDVTKAIREAGVDPFLISDTPPFVKADEPAIEKLERLGAIRKSGGDYLAKWVAQRKVTVRLKRGSHTLTVIYKARPSYALLSSNQIANRRYLAPYCVSATDVQAALGPPSASSMLRASIYSVPVAVDDRPLGSVDVAVDLPYAEGLRRSLIAFCRADGSSALGHQAVSKAPARPDARNVVHILSVATLGKN